MQGGRICTCIHTDPSAGLQGSISEAVQLCFRRLPASEVLQSFFITQGHSKCLALCAAQAVLIVHSFEEIDVNSSCNALSLLLQLLQGRLGMARRSA